jgi:glycogen debranching enzyme
LSAIYDWPGEFFTGSFPAIPAHITPAAYPAVEGELMSRELVRILDGGNFVVSEDSGDIEAAPDFPTGLFSYDTRFLSTWRLTVNGERLHALEVDDTKYFTVRFFLVPGAPTLYVDSDISVIRQRSISQNMHEQLTIINSGNEATDLVVRMEIGSDFADIFEIKDVGQKKGRCFTRVESGFLRLGYEWETFRREAVISSSAPAQIDGEGMTFAVRIEAQASWGTELRVDTLGVAGRDVQSDVSRRPRRDLSQMQHELDQWLDSMPRLECDNESLLATYRQSLVDLAALRYAPVASTFTLPAAGLPWFMGVFGRDSIFTSLQALPFAPGVAATTLIALGDTQGLRLDDFREEEPGKIAHEWRCGETAAFQEQPHSPYYGSADASCLFVILLDEYERWTGDSALVQRLELNARGALEWIGEYGDILGNGYVWYERRNNTAGLENQCWKDSWNSITYHDGRIPAPLRATCELQGYAYDAKVRGARLARRFWNDPAYADRLEREAAGLKQRFNRDFWIEDGQFYALALDANGKPVDSLSSNIGHLLWSGIVEDPRAATIAEHLLGPRLFSGWGVRTLATGEARYNPIGYHLGTVWPFDNSIIAWGLRRYGFGDEAARIAAGIIDAAKYFDGRLPEAFGGYDRDLTKHPVRYPTACTPQAWSTGAPFLFIRTMLGLEPQGDRLLVEPSLPAGIGRLELHDVPGRWGRAGAGYESVA